MIAQLITFQGAQIGLLCAQPNWDTGVKIILELPTDVAKEPITYNEARRNFSANARYTMEWTAYLADAEDSTELRIFLTRIRGETIAVPLWPDGCELLQNIVEGATVIRLVDLPVRYGTSWIIAADDFSTWEIVTGGISGSQFTCTPGVHNAWPAGTIMYPLMFGRLTDRPQGESITDETFEVDIKLKESSQFAYRLSTPSGTIPVVGPNIPAFARTPLLNIAPNHTRPTDWTEQPDIVYETIGFLRQDQQRLYDNDGHRNARGLELEFYQNNRGDLTTIERLWRNQQATTLRFMVPTWRGDLRLLYNTPVPGNPKWIRCEPSEFGDPAREAQPGDPFIALIGQDDSIDPYQISSVTQVGDSETRLMATVNVAAHTVSDTIVSNLLLARFSEAKLEWDYTTPYLATAKIKIRDLPHEYANPPAPLPPPAYIFIFTEQQVRVDRFTSYENTIIIPSGTWAGTYTPAPFSFDKLKVGLKLDQEKLDFKSFKFDGNPLNKMWPFALDGVLTLDVVEVNAANPQSSTALWRFSGDVQDCDSDYKATALAFGLFFEHKFPRFLLGVSDNYVQFSPPTQLPASAFKITGTIASLAGQTILITSVPGHAEPADWFSGGWLEIGTSGTASFERRGIYHSEAAGSNQVTLHIDRPLLKSQAGATISMYPGYDLNIDTCDTKFHNRINFGGHAYIPDINPTVKAMEPQNTNAGKL